MIKKEFRMLVDNHDQAEDVMLRLVDAGISSDNTKISCWAKETPNGKYIVHFTISTK